MAESTLTQNCWTSTRKAAVVLELLRGGEAVEVARRHGLSQAQISPVLDRLHPKILQLRLIQKRLLFHVERRRMIPLHRLSGLTPG